MQVDSFASKTVRVETPDGTMFVIIDENADGSIADIRINIGKSGSSLNAWTYAFTQMVTLALRKGASLEDVITIISNTNSDKLVYNKTTPIRSGPAGFVHALMSYNYHRYQEFNKLLGPPLKEKKSARLWGRSRR